MCEKDERIEALEEEVGKLRGIIMDFIYPIKNVTHINYYAIEEMIDEWGKE